MNYSNNPKRQRPKRSVVASMMAAIAAGAMLLAAGPVNAQDAAKFPEHAVRLIVPYPPGGVTDILARKIAQKVSTQWGQPMFVENVAGASGLIGTRTVAHATPDGYTILFGNTAIFSLNPNLFKALPYDPIRGFAPITLAARVSNALLVSPEFPAKNLEELIALAKKRPGALTFASNSPGSTNHLSGEMLKMEAGIDLLHVPYKSSTAAVIDLMAGRISMMFDNLTTAMPYLKDGRLRALVVTSEKRVPSLPNVKTMAESGFKNFVITPWWGIFAPAGTPQPVVDKLHDSIVAALKDPEINKYFVSQETEVVGNTPQEFRKIVESDLSTWAKVIKAANVKME